MKSFLQFYIFLLLVFLSNSQAQNNQVYFEKYDVLSGLPESSVTDMLEDAFGYIWMGTQNGLVRYDGYNYKVYQLGSENLNLRSSTNVVYLYLSDTNILWVSTGKNGIFKYNRLKDTFIQFSYPENKSAYDHAIFTQDKEGNLWGTAAIENATSYLWKLDAKGNFELFGTQFKNNNYVNASRIYSAFTSKSGTVWFGSSNGFYRYQGKNSPLKGFATSTDSLKLLDVGYIYEAPSQKDVFWMVNIKENKILRFDAKKEVITSFQTKPESFTFPNFNQDALNYMNRIGRNSIYEDKKKQLWFAGYNGMLQFNRNTETIDYVEANFAKEDLDYQKYLYDITETKDGTFWFKSLIGYVSFNPKTAIFERYSPNAELPGAVLATDNLTQKMADHTGTLWLGFMWAGANKSNAKKSSFSIYKHNDKLANSYPKEKPTPADGKNGYLWFSDQKNIYKWNPNSNSFIKKFTADADERFYGSAYVTDDGNLWITTEKYLYYYNLEIGKKEKYASDKVVKNSNIFNPSEDYNGVIWMMTRGEKGIATFDPKTKKIKHYPYRVYGEKITAQNKGALDDVRVTSTYVDRQNKLWIGTNMGGLNLYNAEKDNFINYSNSENENKMLRCVTAMYEDTSGRFWLGTYQSGIFEFDRKNGKCIRHLNEKNGLIFNTVFAINEDEKGRLWIITERGFSRVNPKDLSVKNFPQNTILTNNTIRRNNEQLAKLDNGKFMTLLEDGVVVFDPKDLDANPFPPKVQLESISVINPDAKSDAFETVLAFGKKEFKLTYEQNRVRFNYVGLHYDDPSTNTYAYKLDGYDRDWIQAGTERSVTYTNLSPGTYVFHVKAANSDGVWSTENPSITIVISPPWWKTWWAYLIYFLVFISVLRAYIVFRGKTLKRENTILEEKVTHRTSQLTKSIDDLKNTQSQLIQSEKMASLGELTAGIAHEIQNPLNFVNNFSEVSNELIDEIKEERAKKKEERDEELVGEILDDIKQNLEKINHHGKRADAIVKGMLQHSRSSSGSKEPTDINKLADEYLRLAYHGLRAKDKSFNATLETNYDETIGKINIIPQEIGRVILNLIINAFYATNEKKYSDSDGFEPTVTVSTKKTDNIIEIAVTDNGNGIPQNVLDKIFQPFFTTKPTGQGTGLGLSLAYDIVKAHGGEIKVETEENQGTRFSIQLPI